MSLQFEKPVVLLGRTVSSVGGKPPTYHSFIPLTVLGADSQCRTPVILGTRVLLALLNFFTGRGWVRPTSHPSRHRCFLVAYGLDITCDHRPLIGAWEAECFGMERGSSASTPVGTGTDERSRYKGLPRWLQPPSVTPHPRPHLLRDPRPA